MGVAVTEMPVGFPISLRTGDDPLGGNSCRFAVRRAGRREGPGRRASRRIQRFVSETRRRAGARRDDPPRRRC